MKLRMKTALEQDKSLPELCLLQSVPLIKCVSSWCFWDFHASLFHPSEHFSEGFCFVLFCLFSLLYSVTVVLKLRWRSCFSRLSRQERSENTTQGCKKKLSVWAREVNELESVYMLCVCQRRVDGVCVWVNEQQREREREHKHIAPEGNSSLPRSLHLSLSLSLYLAPLLSSILSLCRFPQPLSLFLFSILFDLLFSSKYMNSLFTLSLNVIFFLLISHVQNSLFLFQLSVFLFKGFGMYLPQKIPKIMNNLQGAGSQTHRAQIDGQHV